MAQYISPKDTFPLPGMTAGVVANGPFLFVSGQVALDEKGAVAGAGDFAGQVEQAMTNLQAVLRDAGATLVMAELISPDLLIEIEAVAALRGD